METQLIFLDTETTGNDLAKDRLCQVCYKTEQGIFAEYFQPPVPMSVKSMSVTHITPKMLKDKQAFIGSKMKDTVMEILKTHVLVAHNAKFDIAILNNEGVEVPKHICTLRVARFLDSECVIPEYNLQFLRYYYELEVLGNAHDAEGDVYVLEAVFERLLKELTKNGLSREEAVQKMIEISSTPSLYKIFNFGKHKDKKIEEVARLDKGYLEWLLNQKMLDGGTDEDWIYTLKFHLGKV